MTNNIENILSQYYGVGHVVANPTTVMWAAEKLLDVKSVQDVKQNLLIVIHAPRPKGRGLGHNCPTINLEYSRNPFRYYSVGF